MSLFRRLILALVLSAGLAPAFAQVPAPVPALPDTERRTSYVLTGNTCVCSVGFALYGDSTDFQNWVEVWLNNTLVNFNDATFGWTITVPTQTLATRARPISDAVLTFNSNQTGTVQIVGARRPRRTSQFNENVGVPTRNFNVVLSDLTAQNRELWDKTNDITGRGFFAPPGQTGGVVSGPLSGVISGPASVVNGDLAVWNGTSGAALKDGGTVPRPPWVDVTQSPYLCIADSGVTDNGPCLRAAYDAVALTGGSIYIPPSSNYYGVTTCRNNAVFDGSSTTVANGNKSVSIIGGGWNEKPFATPQGSWLLPNSSFPAACSWIRLSGTDKVSGTTYSNFGIGEFGGAFGTPKGLHGIFVDASNPAFYIQHMKIDHVFIANMAVGYSIKVTTGSSATPGGIPDAIIANSNFQNFNADWLGDHVTFFNNVIGQNTVARDVGIEFANCQGCTSTVIDKNNISNSNGKIIAHNGGKCVIRDNELEMGNVSNSDGSLVHLVGDLGAVDGCTITGNQLSQNSVVANYAPITVGIATGTQIYDNRIALATGTPYDYVTVSGSASSTFIGVNRCTYNNAVSATADLLCTISSLGPFGFQQTPFGFVIPGLTSGFSTWRGPATGGGTITGFAGTDTIVGKATTDTLTNKTYDTAGAGNVFKIGGTAITAASGTGSTVALTAGPTFTGTTTVANLNATGLITDGNGMLLTNIAAPSTPSAGTTRIYVDSTTKVLTFKNDAGTVGNEVVPSTCGANLFGTSISSAGVFGCTQPAVSNISGFGTGVATALGVNVGSAGAFITNGGALGTPSSGTATSITGLPISTGLTGAGTGVLAALAVNVGTAGSPVVNGGALGTPSSGVGTNITGVNAATLGGATFAAPGAIGGGTPGTIAGTTITGSTSISSPIHTASGALTFESNGTTLAGTITTAQKWGIGLETNPQGLLVVSSNATTGIAVPASTVIALNGADGASTVFAFQSFGTGVNPAMVMRGARGIAATPSASQSGDAVGFYSALGYGASAYDNAPPSGIIIGAGSNHTLTDAGTYLAFMTVANGGVVRAEAMRAQGSGGLSVGTTADSGNGTMMLKKQAFASLTACSSTIEGAMASITDSSTATWGATITGSSTNHVLGYCDGTNWTVAGK